MCLFISAKICVSKEISSEASYCKELPIKVFCASIPGEAFDVRDFHEVVLKAGMVPLTVLESLVDEYIEDTKKRPGN